MLVFAALVPAVLGGCASSPPENTENACEIFREKDDWYDEAKASREKWGAPISLQLAFLHQESRFIRAARPPRSRLLWIIPWTRPSSAYGYAQVTDETWDWYKRSTGNWSADRDDFEDASDFVGWYVNQSHQILGISKTDAYRQYLAYHEGHTGYRRGSHYSKDGLLEVARKVERQAGRYKSQILSCEDELEGPWWWPF